MKLIFLHLAFFLFSINIYSNAQDNGRTQQLLAKINSAVNAVTQGSFSLSETMTQISVGEDTTSRFTSSKSSFRKLNSDLLVGYQLSSFKSDGLDQIYTGDTLYTVIPWNRTLEVTTKSKYPDKIKEVKQDYFTFPYFSYLNESLKYLNKDSSLHYVSLLGLVKHNGKEYYKIQTIISTDTLINKNHSYIFVDLQTLLPSGLYTESETTVGNAKEILIFESWIEDFIQKGLLQPQIAKQALSGYDKEVQFDPSLENIKNPLLPVGSIAPDWELPLVNGGSVKLNDLKGKIVILDFWFKACTPCQKQMIALQKLKDKFNEDSVVFIGINTIDDPVKDKLELFLRNREITMLSAYNGRSIENLYGIYASPVLFVINREGKVILVKDGYSNTLEEDIIKTVRQYF